MHDLSVSYQLLNDMTVSKNFSVSVIIKDIAVIITLTVNYFKFIFKTEYLNNTVKYTLFQISKLISIFELYLK